MGNDNVKDYPPYLDYPKPRKPMTNADRIRSMSDENLAKYLCCQWNKCKNMKLECDECLLDWLKQEEQS